MSAWNVSGYVKDYDQPYNKLAFLVTHNAHSHGQNFALWARNQEYSVSKQLEDGIRGLMLDIYPGWGRVDVRLCHASCYWSGSSSLLTTLIEIRHFLDNHPKEVVTIFFEDYLKNPTLLKSVFDGADISRHVLPVSYFGFGAYDWPTLKDMRSLGRLVVFNNNGLSGFPYTDLDMWYYVRENRYGGSGRNTKTCVDRSQSLKNINLNTMWNIVLVNWFPTIPTPLNPCLNSFTDLKTKLQTCQHNFGHRANFLAVDYYTRGINGGAFQAVKWLNSQWRGESVAVNSKRSDIRLTNFPTSFNKHLNESSINSTSSRHSYSDKRTFYRSTELRKKYSNNNKTTFDSSGENKTKLNLRSNTLRKSLSKHLHLNENIQSQNHTDRMRTKLKASNVEHKNTTHGVRKSLNRAKEIKEVGNSAGAKTHIKKNHLVPPETDKNISTRDKNKKLFASSPRKELMGRMGMKGSKIEKLKMILGKMNRKMPSGKGKGRSQEEEIKEMVASGLLTSSDHSSQEGSSIQKDQIHQNELSYLGEDSPDNEDTVAFPAGSSLEQSSSGIEDGDDVSLPSLTAGKEKAENTSPVNGGKMEYNNTGINNKKDYSIHSHNKAVKNEVDMKRHQLNSSSGREQVKPTLQIQVNNNSFIMSSKLIDGTTGKKISKNTQSMNSSNHGNEKTESVTGHFASSGEDRGTTSKFSKHSSTTSNVLDTDMIQNSSVTPSLNSFQNNSTLSKIFHNSTKPAQENSAQPKADSELADFFDDGGEGGEKMDRLDHVRVARTTTMSPLTTAASARPQVHFFKSNDQSIK